MLPQSAPEGSARGVLGDFLATGAHVFPAPLNAAAAGALLREIRSLRRFDGSLFLTEAAFDADPVYTGVNPRPGRNLLERFDDHLRFVERDPAIVAGLTAILGAGYQVLDRKVVCGAPDSAVPEWLKRRIKGNPVNNLGAFVKPELRDVTYFYGIDFHQDLIDYKDRDADFVTLYVYLHAVDRRDAPLYLLEGSHALGATVFPHALTADGRGGWRYADRCGRERAVRQRVLTGPAGFAAMWHPCTLHGTQPTVADRARLSLRYLIRRGTEAKVGLDAVNAALDGPVRLTATRVDLADDGSARIRGNVVAFAGKDPPAR
ncbi:hypothetical protein [Phenylobacterium sp.]|jgi:hypothetical protein|uniref:hypothetical protein n=1 Tax=Phenylobacterium sp. TaxID=1871053 RepID=UPI002F42490F